jgi:hypothetical protein
MMKNTNILSPTKKYLFLLFPMIMIGLEAHALTCDRYRLDTIGFRNKAAAESYYPKILELDDSAFEPKGGNSKQMRFDTSATESRTGNSQRFIFSLLPNGQLIAALQGRSGYKQPGKAKYKCNLNAVELREKLENQASSTPTAKPKQPLKNQNKVEQSGKMSLSDAKKECAAIGYSSGTEKFGDCVMQFTK